MKYLLYFFVLFINFNNAFSDNTFTPEFNLEVKEYYQKKLNQKDDFIYNNIFLRDILKDISKKYKVKIIFDEFAGFPLDKKAITDIKEEEPVSLNYKNISLKDFFKNLTQKTDLMYAVIISKDDAVICFYSYSNPIIVRDYYCGN